MIALIACLLTFLPEVLSKLEQIGAMPIKGNTWRVKYADEISANLSQRFRKFVDKDCITTTSVDTGITYFLSPLGKIYPHFDEEEALCDYPLGKRNPYDPYIQPFTVYFACDDTCCNLECCQRDLPLSIIGFTFIALAVLILIIYVVITTTSVFVKCRRKNQFCAGLPMSGVTKDGTALTLLGSPHRNDFGDRV